MIWLLAAIPAAYQLLTLAAVLFRRTPRGGDYRPSVSVLKPVRGADAGFYEAIRSNAMQEYPSFEILFGVATLDDPAVPAIRRLMEEFPNVRLIHARTAAPNGKVGVMIDLAREARGEVLVVSDGDIAVPPAYLARVVAPLSDRTVGLVTCAYRARAESFAGRFEALGVATDFTPSAILAPFVGVDEFGLGSTLCFRARELGRIGGFEAIADYLADDYQVGRRIRALGLRCVLSEVVVETHLAAASLAGVWAHQTRWARTVRVSRPGGYAGLPVTFATLWALIALCAGAGGPAVLLLLCRAAMAIGAGWFVLGSSDVLRLAWLIPFRDLFNVAVWIAGLAGSTVEWGGQRLHLTRDGRIH